MNYKKTLENIMNEWYCSLDDLIEDLIENGFDALYANSEMIHVSCRNEWNEYVELKLLIAGTPKTVVVEDYEEI